MATPRFYVLVSGSLNQPSKGDLSDPFATGGGEPFFECGVEHETDDATADAFLSTVSFIDFC